MWLILFARGGGGARVGGGEVQGLEVVVDVEGRMRAGRWVGGWVGWGRLVRLNGLVLSGVEGNDTLTLNELSIGIS